MPKIKLIALDLDGTLLNNQKQISPRNLRALKAAEAAGVRVIFDTGRPLVSFTEFLKPLGLLGPGHYSILINGGLIVENDGKVLLKELLTYSELVQIDQMARKFDLPIDIISEGNSYTVEYGRKALVHYINNRITFIPSQFEDVPKTADFNKAIFSADSDYLDYVFGQFDENFRRSFEIFRTRDILMEVMPKGVTKASGLAWLCKKLDIESTEVLAMGDEANDVPMLKWAGLGIAPANASPEAKAAAAQVSELTNHEDAVADAVEKFVLGGK